MFYKLILAAAMALMPMAAAQAQDYPWKPTKPVTIVVPWGAGGSTDQVVRLLATELESALGQTVVVVNQPGASGSIGTKSVLEAEKEGYTWASGAAKDVGTYAVTGLLDTRLDDWHFYLAVINSSVIGVNADTPYQTLEDLIQAMKANPGTVTVATAGINSSGGAALGAFSTGAGVEARHVTYDGGNPAVIATAGGETEVTTQLAVEQAEMIRAGRIRPLAVVGTKPLKLEGVDEIPAITTILPDFPASDNYFGIFVPAGTPNEVLQTLDMIWDDKIANSKALQDYATSRGAIVAVVRGEEAKEAAMPAIKDSPGACGSAMRLRSIRPALAFRHAERVARGALRRPAASPRLSQVDDPV
ncbi:tripartite tricarboxylate transporter substrate binding protein [Mesorhizobium sp. WSM2239]|uniref:Tripartite tricarboxylate transporter substrate binding protein n=1 Tax=Mesorhizobium sp. WSM2239 TaxID=3228852 RepID=A0AAU8D792_9HYPH